MVKRAASSLSSWCVYLIFSSSLPKTYVGVTTNFSRRLKQHNGESKGGAKASRAGRPWACACIVHGFKGRSEACVFESKWKSISRTLPRRRKMKDTSKLVDSDGVFPLLRHRKEALNRVKGLVDCNHLDIDWQLDPSSFD